MFMRKADCFYSLFQKELHKVSLPLKFSRISYLQRSAARHTLFDSLCSQLSNARAYTFISGQYWSVGHPEDKSRDLLTSTDH